ncbi:hypothetical protein HJC23_004307 [Cyclotella cryptica]|uniref:Uncharacterized protein n=1 Tax=Cyclotella cryptica TaxID=29204 RepID=A0ABD3Q3Y2_9STRA|eukprot:CCRYP_008925-RA/>CCRYP_008925-RA protein AED:0.07 eAED:0.04 QI:0/-1/0/1/-1/1/1/0/774
MAKKQPPIDHETCHETIISINSKKCPQHELHELHELTASSPDLIIDDLRSRLSRRNALLDAIRKAYHRDVIAIKEHLIDLANRGILPSSNNAEHGDALQSFLSSIPSLDLRPTLPLFAPQECELKLHPCRHCGGQLEIIHRESTRIVQYKQAIVLLQEKEKELRCRVIDARVEAKEEQARRVQVMEHAKQEREVLLDQILELKHQVADRDALSEELKRTRLEKQQLEDLVERQRPILEHHERLLVDNERVRQECDQVTSRFHHQVKESETLKLENLGLLQQLDLLQQENQSLHREESASNEQRQQLQDTCSSLALDLSKSKEATNEAKSCLHKAEEAMYELEFTLEREKERAETMIHDLESKCTSLTKSVTNLEEKAKENAEEAASYRRKIDATLEGARRRGSIAFVPISIEEAFAKTDELICEMETHRQKSMAVSNLLISCLRSTYDNCLTQENMLRENKCVLLKNSPIFKNSRMATNEKAQMILESLNNARESDTIEWTSLLDDETDQRHILGNLQNRLQMGQFSLNKCFTKIHKDAQIEMRRCREGHKTEIDEKTSRIWELEKLLTNAVGVNRRYEEKMTTIRNKHENAEQILEVVRGTMRNLRKDCQNNKDMTTKLHDDFFRLRTVTERLLQELRMTKETIQILHVTINEKQEDIDARDEAMQQLEKFLENITHRYAENERLRIKVTLDAAVQAVSSTKDISCVADFLPTPLRTVAGEDDNKSKSSSDALLPGRIIQIQNDENWPLGKYPSMVNIGPPSALGYRKIIDRL